MELTDNKKKFRIVNSNKIKSIQGFDCVGPCYPADTIYYNPLNLVPIKANYPTCPILPQQKDNKTIYADKCRFEDINRGYLYYDVFSDLVQIATSSDNFLRDIYEIYSVSEVVNYLSDSIDLLPIYSQRRILKAIYEVYYRFIEFPKLLFGTKLSLVLKSIYNINIESKQIIKILDKINDEEKYDDLYIQLIKEL